MINAYEKSINDLFENSSYKQLVTRVMTQAQAIEYYLIDNSGTIRMKYACLYLERYRKAGHSVSLEKLYHQLIQVLDETQECIRQWFRQRP